MWSGPDNNGECGGISGLASQTTASSNTAVGAGTLFCARTASDNVALGQGSLNQNITGNLNVAVGRRAGVGEQEADELYALRYGSKNVFIGSYTSLADGIVENQANPVTNAIAIGYKAQVASSNTMVLGGTGDYAVKVGMGTTDPKTRLHVRQSDSGLTPNQVSGIFVENNGSLNDYYVFQTATIGGGKSFSVTNAGNVGVGTTNPLSKLAVNGLPNTPPAGDSSGTKGILCITNNGNIWVDDDGAYDCQ